MIDAAALDVVKDREKRNLKPIISRFAAGDRDVLARSVYLEETNPAGSVLGTIAALTGFVLIFLVWSALTRFDETAAARGEILPINYVQPVQHLEGGIVAEVRLREGDRVKAGDVILVMDETGPRSELQSLKAREAALGLQVERLRAFSVEDSPDFSAYRSTYPQLVADQMSIYRTQTEGRDAQLAVVDSQVAARRQERLGLQERLATLEKQVLLLREEVDMRKTLLDQGLSNRVVYLDTQRRLNEAEGARAQVRTEIARAEAAIAEATGRRLEVAERLRTDALEELGRFAADRAEVNERLTQLEARVERTVVRAPVAGRVKGLAFAHEGTVIRPGELIAEIVPENDEMLAQVQVSPRDIGHVKIGQAALVKVDTYRFARTGGIDGTVKSISASSFQDDEGRPYFKALVSLEQNHVGPRHESNIVAPGMTLVADIKTGEKSLLGYLWRPVYRSLSGAFSER